MMKAIVKYTCCFFVISAINAFGQDAKRDIRKINEAYTKFTDISMTIVYNVYLDQYASSPTETEVGLFKQHGLLRYNKLKEIESLQNNEYSIIVDNEEKRIVLANPVEFDPSKITLMNLDSAFSTCSSVNYLDPGETQGGYEMVFKSNVISQFDRINLYFNKKTFMVEKLVFYYRQKMKLTTDNQSGKTDKPKLEITFSKFDFQPCTDLSFFSEKRFIEKQKGKYKPVTAYNEYKIIDQKFSKIKN